MLFLENQVTEYKREFIDDIKLTAIAFANGDGGTIYIGINDDGTVCGVAEPDEVALKVQNALRDSILPDIMMFVRCGFEKLEGKIVVKVDVHRGTRRPYFLKGKGIRPEGVYVRQGPSTIPASYDAIRQMLIETTGETYERGVSLEQNLTFEYAETYFAQRNVAFGETQKTALGLINKDKLYTNVALLLSDQCGHAIKAARFQGTRKLVFRDRAEFSGSIFKQLEEAYAFIVKHNDLHATYEGLQRIDQLDYPLMAVREGLLNAVVHRDYGTSGPILISIFDDRLEILNQGGLMPKMTIEDVREGVSDPRNKALASVFYRLKLIEAYGTGYDKIDSVYEGSGKRAQIAVTDNSFKLTLPNTNFVLPTPPMMNGDSVDHPHLASSVLSKNAAPSTKSVRRSKLSSREASVLELCRRQGSVTRKNVEAAFGISQTPAVLLLKAMTEAGLLRKIGQGPLTRYVLS